MKIRILSSAVDDLLDGQTFYERQGEGLGDYFLNSLYSDIDSLTLFGGIHAKYCGHHRLLSKRFPYAVYYSVRQNVAVVHRVLDLRQDPGRIRKALSDANDPREPG